MFIKLDLRWEYNNVRIKIKDKWKVAFTTPENSFEPIVMFSRLKNSLATFQAMINEILRDLINTGKIVSFINDIMIQIVSEKEHDELVEEILKRIKENNLYINLEKYR